jgi:hypothetical protein
MGNFITYHSTTTVDNRVYISSTIATLSSNNTYYWQVRTIDTGLRSSTWTAVQQVYVTANPNPSAAVADYAVSAVGVNQIGLTWTSPGENGNTGNLVNATFTLQYSTDSTYSGWDPNAAPSDVFTVNIATSATAGSAQRYILNGLFPSTTYYSRMWTKDAEGFYSDYSNLVSTTTTSPALFYGIEF